MGLMGLMGLMGQFWGLASSSFSKVPQQIEEEDENEEDAGQRTAAWLSDFRLRHESFFYPSKQRQLSAIIAKIKDLHLRGGKLQIPSRRDGIQRNSKPQTPKAWADIIGLGSQQAFHI
jgi:hypothetical protein